LNRSRALIKAARLIATGLPCCKALPAPAAALLGTPLPASMGQRALSAPPALVLGIGQSIR